MTGKVLFAFFCFAFFCSRVFFPAVVCRVLFPRFLFAFLFRRFFVRGGMGECPRSKKQTRKFGIKILARKARICIPNFRRRILRLTAAWAKNTRT